MSISVRLNERDTVLIKNQLGIFMTMWLEQSERQRLKALAGIIGI